MSLYEGTKHSTATHLKALGADDRLLAQLMGHRDPRSVEKYAKVGSSAIRAGLERLRKRGLGGYSSGNDVIDGSRITRCLL